MTAAPPTLVEVRDLRRHYRIRNPAGGRARRFTAVDGVSFSIRRGETLGIVGESGCGKSTLARCLVGLDQPSGGEVRFDGRNLAALAPRALRPLRRRFQMVFQDAHSSLNPRMDVRRILDEPLFTHGVPRTERTHRIRQLLDDVGLPASALDRHPHEFSGGQRQRIGIARALALRPDFVVLDEPVAALDVSVQAQIINLLRDLQKEYGLTYLFIAHDLGVVEHISDRVGVMYRGQLVEIATARDLFEQPTHAYTRTLLAAIPRLPAPPAGQTQNEKG